MSTITTPANLNNEAIEAIAEAARRAFNFESADKIKSVVKSIGGSFKYDWNGTSDGALDVRALGDFTIELSPFTSDLRDVFTIAHELGHYVLHYPLSPEKTNGDVFHAKREPASDPCGQRAEIEANRFAAAFLMPADDFRQQWNERGRNAAEVALHYGVSKSAAETRAKSLRLSEV